MTIFRSEEANDRMQFTRDDGTGGFAAFRLQGFRELPGATELIDRGD
jgi:hypothetical protein